MAVQGLRSMSALLLLLLALAQVQDSWQLPTLEAGDTSSLEGDKAEVREMSDMKRHSEGTFSNDYSKYLQEKKAQNFVRWLMDSKRKGVAAKRHAEGTFTSDLSYYWQDKAVRDFVAMLIAAQDRRKSASEESSGVLSRRHVDGSFTSDVNKVLDSMAAKEYLRWVMSSQTSEES